jgi:unsaturated rhamnogalacturonyl hydrolase
VSKAWRALEAAVQPDGRLGYVQRIGEKPGQTNANSTEAYGTGAFLLAGSEVYKMPYL